MENFFECQVKELYDRINKIISSGVMYKANHNGYKLEEKVPPYFKEEFFKIVDKVNLSLMEEDNNFYGYFIFQMARDIKFNISSPTGVNFKGAKYVIYFNPIMFLQLNIKQMESTIKHEIHHILALHLVRAKELKGKFSTLAINLAMDTVVNQYLNNLPPYATTLEWVNLNYSLKLQPYNTFEYYIKNIQNQLDLLEESEEGKEDDTKENENMESEYNPEKTHDIWEEGDHIEKKTILDFTERIISSAIKGKIPLHIEAMIKSLKSSKGELPWNLYLKKLMGTVESNKKKTITRRNRRQPNRLDLRGDLRGHKAKIAVAIDISGSISDEEFKQAIKEVLTIVKNYSHEITIIECDKEVRRAYKAKFLKDVKERLAKGGSTRFTPVFQYVNDREFNLLIYFTDGKGEDRLDVRPRGYKTLWVISGSGEGLSLRETYGTVKKLTRVEIKDNSLDMGDIRSDGYSMNSQEPTFNI